MPRLEVPARARHPAALRRWAWSASSGRMDPGPLLRRPQRNSRPSPSTCRPAARAARIRSRTSPSRAGSTANSARTRTSSLHALGRGVMRRQRTRRLVLPVPAQRDRDRGAGCAVVVAGPIVSTASCANGSRMVATLPAARHRNARLLHGTQQRAASVAAVRAGHAIRTALRPTRAGVSPRRRRAVGAVGGAARAGARARPPARRARGVHALRRGAAPLPVVVALLLRRRLVAAVAAVAAMALLAALSRRARSPGRGARRPTRPAGRSS